jgi:LPS-assembly lipoprotein
MSLPDRCRAALLLVLTAGALSIGGCTVRPLYSDASIETGAIAGAATGARQIYIEEVRTRYGQDLRNNLIFLLNGGAGQPDEPRYRMALNASVTVTDQAVVSVVNENRPTVGLLQMTADYVLTDAGTGEVVTKGARSVTSSFDHSAQEFANMRARRDAEDRAARELAEMLRLDVAQRLAKG